jgi:O-antigen/teichoic acid export membrane protein
MINSIVSRASRVGLALLALFSFKLLVGMVVLAASARWLSVPEFATFSQLLVLLAFLVTITSGGVQHGLIREAAAAQNLSEVAKAIKGGFLIWAGVGVATVIACFLARDPIAIALTGNSRLAWTIPLLAVLASASGLGQLFCSVLTGTDRASSSMLIQGLGLAMSSLCVFSLANGDATGAALIFAAGPIIGAVAAGWLISPICLGNSDDFRTVLAESRRLLNYSVAFLAAATIMPVTLMTLRASYHSAFGLSALGYWIAANRISDVNTQLIGLYLTQTFLPSMARSSTNAAAARKLLRRTFVIVTALGLIGLLIFLLAPAFLVTAFLSAKFLPAVPWIITYFIGDALRAGASIASFTFMAEGRLRLYVGLEAVSATVFGIAVLSLIVLRVEAAGPIGYAVTYGVVSLAAGLVLYAKGRSRPADHLI